MKITGVTTTLVRIPSDMVIADATASWSGHGGLFVHIQTDEGVEGLGIGNANPAVRAVIEGGLKRLLLGRDPLNTERL